MDNPTQPNPTQPNPTQHNPAHDADDADDADKDGDIYVATIIGWTLYNRQSAVGAIAA